MQHTKCNLHYEVALRQIRLHAWDFRPPDKSHGDKCY